MVILCNRIIFYLNFAFSPLSPFRFSQPKAFAILLLSYCLSQSSKLSFAFASRYHFFLPFAPFCCPPGRGSLESDGSLKFL